MERKAQAAQLKQNDQSDKFYTLAEKIAFKQMGILPLGFNEHSQIWRSRNLTYVSDDQSIKSTIHA